MNIGLLKRLCETPGVPGREERVRELIQKEVRGLFDEVSVDPMGSLICRRGPRGGRGTKGKGRKSGGGGEPTRGMLLCHMDEIGFYVSHVDAKGWIWLSSAGGFDARNLFSRRVLVCTENGDFKGVLNPGGRPIHISSPEERAKVPEVKAFFVDLGLPAEEVKKLVQVGDFVVMDEPCLTEVGNKVVSKALDNRVACWLGIESIRQLEKSGRGHEADVAAAATMAATGRIIFFDISLSFTPVPPAISRPICGSIRGGQPRAKHGRHGRHATAKAYWNRRPQQVPTLQNDHCPRSKIWSVPIRTLPDIPIKNQMLGYWTLLQRSDRIPRRHSDRTRRPRRHTPRHRRGVGKRECQPHPVQPECLVLSGGDGRSAARPGPAGPSSPARG
ncbi:hypothetical protein J4558_18180 [Leptolyngbya sp. 15MV]|nr:hypothetical protein J4558_18180 [Leptolyngbya sp. 15MV]